jgi:hypothetical protein
MPRFALFAWLLLIAWWTLTPAPEATAAVDLTPWWCISCGEIGTADLLQNLLLFVPVGHLLRHLHWRFRPTFLTGLALTLLIEVCQATVLSGRDAALGDVVENVAGIAIGWALYPALRYAIHPTPTTANRIAGVPLIAFALQLAFSAWLLRPAPGVDGWTIDRAPQHHDGTRWPELVGDVTLERRADTVRFAVTTHWPTTPPAQRVTIARVTHGPLDGVAGVSVAPGTITAGLRTHARDVRLRSPLGIIALPTLSAGDQLSVRVTHAPGTLDLSAVSSSGATSSARVPVGAQHGWVLINPFTTPVDLSHAWARWTLAWLTGWGMLLGFGAGATRQWWGWAFAGAAAGLGVPWLTGTPLRLWEMVALATAWAMAAGAGRMRRRGHSTVE